MGRRAVPFFLFLFLLSCPAFAAPLDDFEQALDSGDLSSAQTLLEGVPEDDLEGLIARGLLHHAASHQAKDDPSFRREVSKAKGYLERAARLAPRRLDARLELGDLLIDLGEDDAFLAAMSALLREKPREGWLWTRDERPPQDPERLIPGHLEEVAWGLLRGNHREDTRLALRIATLLVQYEPRHPGGFRVRGRVALDMGRFENAKRDLTASLRLDPEDSESWMDLGTALWELREDKDSRLAYERVLLLNNDPDAVNRAREYLRKMREEGF
jgi:tetratricopeptide (TPR) repeat protein